MLLGTVPVIFPVIATVLAGAFMLIQGTNSNCYGNIGSDQTDSSSSTTSGLWSSVADVALLVTAIVQGTCFLMGIYYVEKTSRECKEGLAELPYDEELMHWEETKEKKRSKKISDTFPSSSVTNIAVFSTMICLLSFGSFARTNVYW